MVAKSGEDIIEVLICDDDQLKVLKIGSQLDDVQKEAIMQFLRANLGVFASKHSNMVGISPAVMCHHLKINPNHRPIKQKRRSMDTTRYKALKNEMDRLLEIGFIREAHYPRWLTNPVCE